MGKRIAVHLSVGAMLPIIREALDNKTLQMFTAGEDSECLYSGPCAIGVCMTPDQRAHFDRCPLESSGTGIYGFLRSGAITTDNAEALKELQSFHDAAVREVGIVRDKKINEFVDYLAQLEEEYAR